MAGTWVVVPPGFEKRPAERGALATCWFVDAGIGAVMGLGATIAVAVLLSPVSVHPGGPQGHGEMSAWAVALSVGAGCVAAVCSMAFGTGGRSVGHTVAEIRVGRASDLPSRGPADTIEHPDDLVLRGAAAWRRAVRAAAPVAVFVGIAWWSVPLAAAVATLLWLPGLLAADRRGPYERIAGVADVVLEPVR